MLFDIGNEDFLTVLELPGGQDHDYTVQAGWTARTADGSQSWLNIENMGLILAVTMLCIFVPPLLFSVRQQSDCSAQESNRTSVKMWTPKVCKIQIGLITSS